MKQTKTSLPSILTITNRKGGCSKTTSAVNLAACFAASGKRVLLVDFDRQANATELLGARERAEAENKFLARAIFQDLLLDQIRVPSGTPRIDVLAGNLALELVRDRLATQGDNHLLLSAVLDCPALKDYDLVIIDTDSSWDCLKISALTASHYYLIPCFPEPESTRGLFDLLASVKQDMRRINPSLTLLGCFFSKYDRKNTTHVRYEKIIRVTGAEANFPVLTTVIPDSKSVQAASSAQMPLITYRPKSPISHAYSLLAGEVSPELRGRRVGRISNLNLQAVREAAGRLTLDAAEEF